MKIPPRGLLFLRWMILWGAARVGTPLREMCAVWRRVWDFGAIMGSRGGFRSACEGKGVVIEGRKGVCGIPILVSARLNESCW
jgi:hypothetical protein